MQQHHTRRATTRGKSDDAPQSDVVASFANVSIHLPLLLTLGSSSSSVFWVDVKLLPYTTIVLACREPPASTLFSFFFNSTKTKNEKKKKRAREEIGLNPRHTSCSNSAEDVFRR